MTVTTEPSRRWVRGTVGDTTIVDSKHPVLVWEQGRPVPHYAFPRDEVRAELLSEAATRSPSKHADATAWYDLTVDGTRIAHAAWGYSDGELADHISFDWHDVEHWYEEEEEILVHPRDTHHRVDPIQSSRHVRVEINGTVVADTHRPILLFETRLPTRYYIPPEDVNFELLTPTDNSTQCPYKGTARYWSFADVANVVWSYPDPIPAAAQIKDMLAFYNEIVDIYVDGEKEERPVTPFSKQLAAHQ